MANASKPGVVNIRGKEYQTVALRVQQFREAHPEWSIVTEILAADETVVRMKATISNETLIPVGGGPVRSSQVIATGHAEEYRGTSDVNKTSALENCETSAIGRALAAAGYGGTEFATADELVNALTNKPNVPGRIDVRTELGKDAMDELDPEKQSYIHREAIKLDAMFRDGQNVGEYVVRQDYDTECKLALWGLLTSEVRTAIKAQSLKNALASQA